MPSLEPQGKFVPVAPAQTRLVERTDGAAIYSFRKENYTINATFGERRALMRSIVLFLDSSAVPSLMHLQYVTELWRSSNKLVRGAPLIDTSI